MKHFIISLVFSFAALHAFNQSVERTESSSKTKKWIKITAAPVVLISAGLLTIDEDHALSRFSIREERNEAMPYFHTHLDNYLQYTPFVAVYALNGLGIKGKNDLINASALLIKSELLMTAIVYPLKQMTHQLRPDSSNYHSFPSGHTAQAFAAATFLQKEYGSKSIWYSIGGYTVATGIGVCRVLNNKHWLSDVLVGAGIGILSTNLVYHTHRYRWGKKPALTILPTYGRGPGLYLAYKFK